MDRVDQGIAMHTQVGEQGEDVLPKPLRRTRGWASATLASPLSAVGDASSSATPSPRTQERERARGNSRRSPGTSLDGPD